MKGSTVVSEHLKAFTAGTYSIIVGIACAGSICSAFYEELLRSDADLLLPGDTHAMK